MALRSRVWAGSALFERYLSPVLISRVFVVVAVIAQVVVAWRFWHLTWDDSAITLAFARTFALTGRIEGTPGSGIVEGYSSTLWMLLMAAAAKIVGSAAALLVFAKVTTLGLNIANIALIRRWFATWNTELLANLVAGTVGCVSMFYETINGMETPLILTLILLMLLCFPKEEGAAQWSYLLLGSLFVLVRWEGAFLLVPFVLVAGSVRRALLSAGVWASAFVLSNLVRWRYFGSPIPNPIVAKSGPPYSEPLSLHELWNHFEEIERLFRSCRLLLLIVVGMLLLDYLVLGGRYSGRYRFPSIRRASSQLRFTVLFTLCSLTLTWAIGYNTGPEFRAFFPAWPFLFALLMMPITSAATPLGVALATILICLASGRRVRAEVHELGRSDAPIYDSDTTVGSVGEMAGVLSHLRAATNRAELIYAAPDVGGVMLFGEHVRVIDLGLLCDRVLARKRYSAIGSYVLEERRPDVIEMHDGWTRLVNFLSYPIFARTYAPILVDEQLLFVRKDLLAAIDPSRLEERQFTSSGTRSADALVQTDPLDEEADEALNKAFGSYQVLR